MEKLCTRNNFFYYVKELFRLLQNNNKGRVRYWNWKTTPRLIIDKTFSRKCRLYCQLFILAKNFKQDEKTCNSCFKITTDIDKFGRMYVIWKDNWQYRNFTNLWSFAQEIMNKEDLIDKCGYIDIKKYNCKTTQALDSFEIKEKPWVALQLHCWTNDSNVSMQNTYLVAMLLNTLWHTTEDS